MMSNGRMVKSLKLKLRIFGALAGMTSLLITLLPTYVQAETWTEDSDPNNYVMEDLPLSGGGTGTLVKEYKELRQFSRYQLNWAVRRWFYSRDSS